MNEDIQSALDDLRKSRSNLFAIAPNELNALSDADQEKYGKSLFELGQAIMKLETKIMSQINQDMATKVNDLKNAASNIKEASEAQQESHLVIRTIASALSLVTSVVNLL